MFRSTSEPLRINRSVKTEILSCVISMLGRKHYSTALLLKPRPVNPPALHSAVGFVVIGGVFASRDSSNFDMSTILKAQFWCCFLFFLFIFFQRVFFLFYFYFLSFFKSPNLFFSFFFFPFILVFLTFYCIYLILLFRYIFFSFFYFPLPNLVQSLPLAYTATIMFSIIPKVNLTLVLNPAASSLTLTCLWLLEIPFFPSSTSWSWSHCLVWHSQQGQRLLWTCITVDGSPYICHGMDSEYLVTSATYNVYCRLLRDPE
jgi:hypothetical protein